MHILAACLFGAIIVVSLAVMAGVYATAQSPSEGRVAVIFSPSTSDEQAITAITIAGARPIGQGWVRWVWAADLDTASAKSLEAAGALLVVRELPFVAALGCAGSYVANTIKLPSPAVKPAR